MKTKICIRCNIEKPLSDFYKTKRNKDGYRNTCKQCHCIYTSSRVKNFNAKEKKKHKSQFKAWRNKKSKSNKAKAIKYKGGKCCVCGYNKCIAALDFHHINPKEKEGKVCEILRLCSWKRIKIELDKCMLLCSNCHRELHYKE